MTTIPDRCPTCGVELTEPPTTDDCPDPEAHGTIALPDGSTAIVERTDPRTSIIRRQVDGETVWGQVFSTNAEEHPAQVARVVASMVETPANFTRWAR